MSLAMRVMHPAVIVVPIVSVIVIMVAVHNVRWYVMV
jgi:hypothetical protein